MVVRVMGEWGGGVRVPYPHPPWKYPRTGGVISSSAVRCGGAGWDGDADGNGDGDGDADGVGWDGVGWDGIGGGCAFGGAPPIPAALPGALPRH